MENKERKTFSVTNECFFRKELLTDILDIEKRCFPKNWQYSDASDYYKKMLKKKDNIHIFAKENNLIAGYLLAKPHNDVFIDLSEYDIFFKKKLEKFYYLETIGIISDFRGMGLAEKMMQAFIDEAKKRNVLGVSIHARVLNKLNEKIKKLFSKDILEIRKIDKWFYGGGESYEYIEWKI